MDYWLTTNRWKNTVVNMESDTKANIDSDHHPVMGTLETKLEETHLQEKPDAGI